MIGIVSGDRRLLFLQEKLIRLGVVIKLFESKEELEELQKPLKGIILSLPGIAGDHRISGLGLPAEELSDYLESGAFIVGGKLPEEVKKHYQQEGFQVIDYYEDAITTEIGGVATAEAVMSLLSEELSTTIMGTHIMVIGYGRIGKHLVRLLEAYGAKVTVVARNPLARYQAAGTGTLAYKEVREALNVLSFCEVVINTVPAMMLGKAELDLLEEDSLVVDIASAPGGVDFIEAAKKGIRTLWAVRLPEKFAPQSVADGILTLLAEKLPYELFGLSKAQKKE